MPPIRSRTRVPSRLAATLIAAAAVVLGSGCTTGKDEFAGRSAEKLYADARADMLSGSYEQAAKALERVEGLGAGTLLSQQAQLDLAYTRWKMNDRPQALATIDRFIKFNPSSPALDYALYLRGVINFNDNLGLFGSLGGQDLSERDQQASRDAWQAFKQLVDQFPASRYAADARLRMDYIVNALAAYEVHVARYYFNRGAYVAAANRAQQAVAQYPQAPTIEEALHIMVRSYDKLQLVTLRDDAERVLRANYPESRFIAGAKPQADAARPWWRFW
ncbi:MAG TPA: outer membrane protein assembly factor BamD [Rubrivivax sp.]|nr:outer membrane protein assembly factor BamD [Burkholderiales bacterium]HNT39172.1 outer membrane protein assembly factor BamD [Rubrivivax sp.]